MSYQVLARKWRPRTFPQMVGQEHVLRALINALDNDRLHHAFLFTGTRGVGKTSVARLLAKSLNCEEGMSSSPCGVCSACREIDEGRFVDLIEVDAASRTKVEDTRDLLDNVQYAPSRGRYKVYLIDEVHMLSGHSFNALLKTLEEPPPHVKFLLATTDPQKLPVTILSRCLQFNLKRLPLEQIRDHLAHILKEEGIEAEIPALTELSRAADGSMRDALSLLDQAIAFGGGKVSQAEVREMLGSIDRDRVTRLLSHLADGDGEGLMNEVTNLAEQSPDFGGVLEELNSLLHRVALAQRVPSAIDESMGDREALLALAEQLSPEQVQLYYQIGIIGRRDLPLAPEPRSGFEMVLLRMLAFQPSGSGLQAKPTPQRQSAPAAAKPKQAVPAEAVAEPAAPSQSTPTPKQTTTPQQTVAPGETINDAAAWATLVAKLPLTGMTRQLAEHTAPLKHEGDLLELALDKGFENLLNPKWQQGLQQALDMYFGRTVKLNIKSGEAPAVSTPKQMREEQQTARQQEAEHAISNDPELQSLLDHFGGEIEAGSVRPTE
jgi:DNA polymerase III subunit gamma/tau